MNFKNVQCITSPHITRKYLFLFFFILNTTNQFVTFALLISTKLGGNKWIVVCMNQFVTKSRNFYIKGPLFLLKTDFRTPSQKIRSAFSVSKVLENSTTLENADQERHILVMSSVGYHQSDRPKVYLLSCSLRKLRASPFSQSLWWL